MAALYVVSSESDLITYQTEQVWLLSDLILLRNRIHREYDSIRYERQMAYLKGDDEFYDKYAGPEWELLLADCEIEQGISEQAFIVEYACSFVRF